MKILGVRYVGLSRSGGVALFGPRLGGCKLLGGLHLIGTAELGFLFSRASSLLDVRATSKLW